MVATSWLERLSRWVPFKVPAGTSLTTQPVLPEVAPPNGGFPKGSKRTPRYELRDTLGLFEMIGPVKKSGGYVLYMLRHTKSGKIIYMNRDTMQCLFKFVPMET